MENNISKIKTYLGFAIKSLKVRFGVDDIVKLKKADLILVSDSLTESGQQKINTFAKIHSIYVKTLNQEEFAKIVNNINIKAAAILDKNLADAIKKNLTNN